MLKYLTAGESHGKGLTAILEGMPCDVPITAQNIDFQLKRRQQGYGRGGRMNIESDTVEILAGVRHGLTLGSPIALWIENKDHKSWADEMSADPINQFVSKKKVTRPRPGHADINGGIKYNQHDLRNILERASARETASRVAVGAVCRALLKEFGILVTGHVINIGGETISTKRPNFETIQKMQEKDPCRCIQPKVSQKMQEKIDTAQKNGDTLGGKFEIIFTGVPVGLGSHVHWDRKLDAQMAATILSIQAIKGVEFGTGFELANHSGSQVHDPIRYDKDNKRFCRPSNHSGGMEGGMTTGEDIVVRAVMKPISTLYQPLESVDVETKKTSLASVERSDICAVPAACVIAENATCFDLAQAMTLKFGGDSLEEMKRNFDSYLKQMKKY